VDSQGFINLISPAGQALLAEVGPLDSKTDALKLVTGLRKTGHDPDLIANVLTQIKLRRKATEKFGEFAQTMIFTQAGLEQASRLQVAGIHAGRFRAAGLKHVADLGCGIGTESMAMASLDIRVTAFELDELTAAVASYNLAAFENVIVKQADITQIDLTEFDGLFLDPARRDNHSRKYDPADFSPSFDFVLETARTRPTVLKLGPGMPREMIPEDSEAVWVSVNGDLVELTLYFGSLRRPEVRKAALLITNTGSHELTSNNSSRLDAELDELGEYIYEPDSSLIRSQLIGELAQQLNLKIFSPEIAYLTSNENIDSVWLKKYKLLDNLPFDRKRLKAYLNERNIGPLEIKKRGTDVTPEQLRKELNLKGKNPATLIITRVNDNHRVLVVAPR